MTLSPQDKQAVEAQARAINILSGMVGYDATVKAMVSGPDLASLLSSRAPGVGLKRYVPSVDRGPVSMTYGVRDADGKFIGSLDRATYVYLASEVDPLLSSLPREYTAENIGEAPDGKYRCKYPGIGWPNNGDRSLGDILESLANAEKRAKDGKPPVVGLPIAYFGPQIQPPRS